MFSVVLGVITNNQSKTTMEAEQAAHAAERILYTREDVKAATGLTDRQLQYLRDTRRLGFIQSGRLILYPAEAVDKFVRDHFVAEVYRQE
jgi:hypothetical protein